MLFRYLAARLRHRGRSTGYFMRAGLGLERRSQSLSVYWNEHFSRSRAAQGRWAQTCTGEVLTVLGAGPLLDFNTAALSPCFRRFRLVDANPLLIESWKRLNKPVEPVITDISGSMLPWCETVRRCRGSWNETMNVIRELAAVPIHAYSEASDALLSLNILSQLEVGWQEALEPILQSHFGAHSVKQHEQDWLEAIRPSSQSLVEQHLAAIERSGAKYVLLISDVEYVEYAGRSYSRHRLEPPPLIYADQVWQADSGITFELTPALEGMLLSTDAFSRWMPSYDFEWQDQWLWHIAPNGTEAADHGKLHRVEAWCLHCRDASTSLR